MRLKSRMSRRRAVVDMVRGGFGKELDAHDEDRKTESQIEVWEECCSWQREERGGWRFSVLQKQIREWGEKQTGVNQSAMPKQAGCT